MMSSVHWVCLLALANFLIGCDGLSASARADGERVEVSGGGLVRQGDNVTLSLVVGEAWDRCYWFRYGHLGNPNEFDYCSFELDPDTNIMSLRKCDSEELKAMLVPVQDDSGFSCSVMLVGMDESMEGKWASRLDTDLDPKEVELVMARAPSKIEVLVETEAVVGRPTRVACKVEGGKPQPSANFTLQSNNSSVREVSFSNLTVSAIENNSTSLHTAVFLPELTDAGASVACIVTQTDESGLILDQETVGAIEPLNLLFAPQPAELGQVLAVVGEKGLIVAPFRCNPFPTSVEWQVECGRGEEDDIGCLSQKLIPGQVDTRFNVSQVEVQGEDSSYSTSLEIVTVEKGDFAATFSLNVTNPYGFQIYKFSLSAEPTTTATTKTPTTIGSLSPEESDIKDGRNTAGVVIVLLVIAIISVGVLLLYRRRKSADGEMAPLTTP